MTETTIYIQKELTPEVLKSLEKDKTYICLAIEKGEIRGAIAAMGRFVGDRMGDNGNIRILLPIKVTKDMVEKEAEKEYPRYVSSTNEQYEDDIRFARRAAFSKAINWLLNYKEDNK